MTEQENSKREKETKQHSYTGKVNILLTSELTRPGYQEGEHGEENDVTL